MEVLKHGKTYKTFVCQHCEAEIGYCRTDIQPYGPKRFGSMDFYNYIKCPECGYAILFLSDEAE